jgi:hypothetical protein
LWLADSKRVLRGWFPLTLDRTISWLTYLQVRLKMQDMFVDSTGGAVPRAVDSSMNSLSTSPINSVGSSSKVSSELSVPAVALFTRPCWSIVQVTNAATVRIIKQMDDF